MLRIIVKNSFFCYNKNIRCVKRHQSNQSNPKAVILCGNRTPFYKSSVASQNPILDVTAQSIDNFCVKNRIPENLVEYCILGNGVQCTTNSNIAREAISVTNSNRTTPGHTINAACISSLLAATSATDMIESQSHSNVLIGGVDIMSKIQIRYNKQVRRDFIALSDSMPLYEYIVRFIFNITNLWKYEYPEFRDYFTSRTMIEECEMMAKKHNISTADAEAYTKVSFQKAIEAEKNNLISNLIDIIEDKNIIQIDENIAEFDNILRRSRRLLPKASQYMKCLNKRQIKLDSLNWVTTSATCSRPYDGASFTFISSESFAEQNKIKPKAVIQDYIIVAHDPNHEFLMSPAYAIPELLKKHNLTFDDIDVFEIHEAFSTQILVLLKYLNDGHFLDSNFGLKNGLGVLTVDRINKWGGTLAFGHPLAATGSRLINMAVDQLEKENKRYALVSSCSTGGQAVAILLQRYSNN